MTDFLKDQAEFMVIVHQTVGINNPEQTALYDTLLTEELHERYEAIEVNDKVEEFDADLDILVVHLGRMISRWPLAMIEEGWQEVMRSNLSKADGCTTCYGKGGYAAMGEEFESLWLDCGDCGGTGYTVQRREDGKILKPATYSPPDLKSIMEKYKNV